VGNNSHLTILGLALTSTVCNLFEEVQLKGPRKCVVIAEVKF
jgi:hypothetical protein